MRLEVTLREVEALDRPDLGPVSPHHHQIDFGGIVIDDRSEDTTEGDSSAMLRPGGFGVLQALSVAPTRDPGQVSTARAHREQRPGPLVGVEVLEDQSPTAWREVGPASSGRKVGHGSKVPAVGVHGRDLGCEVRSGETLERDSGGWRRAGRGHSWNYN